MFKTYITKKISVSAKTKYINKTNFVGICHVYSSINIQGTQVGAHNIPYASKNTKKILGPNTQRKNSKVKILHGIVHI